jgi:methyl-accepting chemotaxis protein
MKFINRLMLWQKFLILAGLALLLAVVPFVLFLTEANERVAVAVREQRGLAPAAAMLKVLQGSAVHRGSSSAVLAGNEALAAVRQTAQVELDQAVAALDALVAAEVNDDRIKQAWRRIVQDWRTIATAAAGRTVAARANFAAHTELIDRQLVVLDDLLDHFGLTRDPEPHTHALIRASLGELPRAAEAMGQLRGLGATVLTQVERAKTQAGGAQASIATADRAALAAMVQDARQNADAAGRNLQKVVERSPEAKARLEGVAFPALGVAQKAVKLGQDEIVTAEQHRIAAPEYFKQMTDAIDAVYRVNDEARQVLTEEFERTVSRTRRGVLGVAAAILALFGIGGMLGFVVIRSVTRPVRHLMDVTQKLAKGDDEARARLDTKDEIGRLGAVFDEMMDVRVAKLKKENERLNDSVLALLQGVAQLSRKDLTVKVAVAEDVTGPVADALNLLTSETGKVLGEVTSISADVTAASLKVKEQSDTVKQVAEVERREVEHTAERLAGAAETMGQIAELAKVCNQAADNAIKTTQTALETVLSTVGGINSTRDTIRETEKRIKRLGERSQEISGVVNLINTIAERTHILALNASMHAASAGEAGRGFAVVADEVQRLAENARQATAQIASLVNNIQVETADTVNTMNNAIAQVVEGSRLAEAAGQQMQKTEASTSELVSLVQRIAASSQEQAKASGDLLKRAEEIRKSTEQTSERLTEQGQYTANLVEYARNLLAAVRVFKLPTQQAG